MSKRIFYASHAVGVTQVVDEDNNVVVKPNDFLGDTIEGAQSVSLNTNYNLEQVFQLGRLAVYDNYSTDPEVEITINKALDGRPLIWNRATNEKLVNLYDQANYRPDIVLHVDEETQDAIDGNPTAAIKMTGCYFTSINYTFPVDGNFTEEINFVSSNKSSDNAGLSGPPDANPDQRILRRQNFNLSTSTLPSGVTGKCITNVSISANVNREKMFCLGEYAPFHRYINYPIEITVAFDTNPDGDPADSLAGPNFNSTTTAECGHPTVDKEPIIINVCRLGNLGDPSSDEIVYSFNLGSGCSLQSVSYSGGDTGGGNVTETYTYITYNDLEVEYFTFA